MKHYGRLFIFFFLLACIISFSACSGRWETVADNGTVAILQSEDKIKITAPKGSNVYYTTDGSVPNTDSLLYEGPFRIKPVDVLYSHDEEMAISINHIYTGNLPAANVIRAFAVSPEGKESEVITATCYLEKPELMTFSLITDYDNLLDYDEGILVRGRLYDEWADTPEGKRILEEGRFWHSQGNFSQKGKKWERPVTIEILDGDSRTLFDCGLRVKGGSTRTNSQKSFNIYMRDKYGPEKLMYRLFDDGPESYSSFTLRNGGNDSMYLKFKDAWIQDMVKGMDFTTQLSRPVLVYINGEYWGIYTLQEKYCEEYFRDHFDCDDVIMIKESEVDIGNDEDITLYNELMNYADADLADPETWERFKQIIDIDSMADYFATEVYIGNCDLFMDANFALWRSREKEDEGYKDGRWRFVLYDTEYSSSLYGYAKTGADYDHLSHHMESFPLLAAAMRNPEFREKYNESIRRLQEIFSDSNVEESLKRYDRLYRPHVENYHIRFGGQSESYDASMNTVKGFFSQRAAMDMTVSE